MDDMYHVCRWCKHYKDGVCFRGIASHDLDAIVWDVAEDGRLAGVIEETLNSTFPRDLIEGIKGVLREGKVSEKRIKEVERFYDEKLPEVLDFDLKEKKEKLDEAVSSLYQDSVEKEVGEKQGLIINDPEDFYCKYFE